MKWTKNRIISDILKALAVSANPSAPAVETTQKTGATF